jgi:hypothetical protein
MNFKPQWYDPPSGWAYGFPKAWPSGLERTTENIKNRLILDGYPITRLDEAVRHCRFGGHYEETDD